MTLFPDSGCYQKWRDVMATTTGIDYTIKKKHAFSLFYRYQQVYDKDEEEGNIHNIGLSYKFKF